jgi:hypothetical protein
MLTPEMQAGLKGLETYNEELFGRDRVKPPSTASDLTGRKKRKR